MSITIYGNTVGTPTSPQKIGEVLNPVMTVNGQAPDEKGNVEIKIPEGVGTCLLTTETITIGEVGDVPVTGIELDYSTMQINQGDSFQIAATVLPANATNNIVKWRSSDESIATVVDGYVIGIAGGNVTITAYSLENNHITATCAVTVADASAPEGGKIYFKDIAPVKSGAILNKNGKTEFTDSATKGYYKIPYTEGMFVSTAMHSGWLGAYPPIFVVENGEMKTVSYDTAASTNFMYPNYTATLTGFSDNVEVYVNVVYVGSEYEEICYYIEGGAS